MKAVIDRAFGAVEEALRKRQEAGLPMPKAIEWKYECVDERTHQYALVARFIESLEDQEG